MKTKKEILGLTPLTVLVEMMPFSTVKTRELFRQVIVEEYYSNVTLHRTVRELLMTPPEEIAHEVYLRDHGLSYGKRLHDTIRDIFITHFGFKEDQYPYLQKMGAMTKEKASWNADIDKIILLVEKLAVKTKRGEAGRVKLIRDNLKKLKRPY